MLQFQVDVLDGKSVLLKIREFDWKLVNWSNWLVVITNFHLQFSKFSWEKHKTNKYGEFKVTHKAPSITLHRAKGITDD